MDVIDDDFGLESLLPGVHLPELLRAGARVVRAPAGTAIFAEGDGDARLYLVGHGRVQVGRSAGDGRACTFTVHGPGEMFGEESVFDPGPRSSGATAITDLHALTMDRHSLSTLLTTHPQISQGFLRVMSRRIRRTSGNITDTVHSDVAARVAKHLLWLAQRFGVQEDGALRVPMDFTQQQFAYLVGASRESVNKTLGDFADQGWIVVGNDSIMIRESEPLATRTHGTRRQHPSPAGGRR